MTLTKTRAGYVVVLEKACNKWNAHVPDLPGCVAADRTYEGTMRLMEDALTIHLCAMRAGGERVQQPRSLAELQRRRLLPQC
jgi:predicted RNase H-like HicB family nuclease